MWRQTWGAWGGGVTGGGGRGDKPKGVGRPRERGTKAHRMFFDIGKLL